MSDEEKLSMIVNLYLADKVGSLSAEEFTKLYLDTETKVKSAYFEYHEYDGELPDISVQTYD